MNVSEPLLATIEADEPSVENTKSGPRSARPVAPQTTHSQGQMATTESDAESGPRFAKTDYIVQLTRIFCTGISGIFRQVRWGVIKV